MEPPSGFEDGTSGLGIQQLTTRLLPYETQLTVIYEVYGMWWGIEQSANVVPPQDATVFNVHFFKQVGMVFKVPYALSSDIQQIKEKEKDCYHY